MEKELIVSEVNRVNLYEFLSYIKTRIWGKKIDFMRNQINLYSKEVFFEPCHDYLLSESISKNFKLTYTTCIDWELFIDNPELLSSLLDLPIRNQKILWMIYILKEPQKEIAKNLNVSPGTISLIHKNSKKILFRKMVKSHE
ncbi:sigma factor-like helix-turn-helix DNA-binding protein [Facklamia miroungae]|uniref:RNA polymerase sigma factor, sigma-70 family n=1 Tax=Facklamia miroungae TaxID=120956 RepID=A0A1G7VB83_9LACT|nr:sigma factor-like helix-turn-helix DNA-binding protein [Facklamia miroungae]NKZ30293.1 sigma-70 family RNA polymerase sigma factor [Facklamia miroungae]SDG56828.1 RNA polymerase sigma factor, sigma-70 family [Facklamia miroungae]